MTTGETTWCVCANGRVDIDRCDYCDPIDDYDDNIYVDPPLYPVGKLAGMTVEQLRAEHVRQCDRQGRLGDAEHIDDRAVEETERRCRLVEDELKRRGAKWRDG